MITSAQRISVNRARLFLPLDSQWRQDVGPNVLTDSDMESPIVEPPWAADRACIRTKETGSPHSGTRHFRVQETSATFPGGMQPVAANTVFHFGGWLRGDGGDATRIPRFDLNVSGAELYGTAANSWQQVDTVFSTGAMSPSFVCRLSGGGVVQSGRYADFDDAFAIERPTISRNLGGYPGAPTYVRIGDGHIAASLPAQRSSSRGVALQGTGYLRVPMDFVYNEPFTISILTDSILPAASWLAATYDSATLRGIRFGTTGSGALVAGIFDDGGRSITLTSANNVIPTTKQIKLYTLSFDGGPSAAGMEMRIDDMVVPATAGGTSIESSISSGRDMLIGARWNGATPTEIMAASNIYCASEFPTVLDSYEIRMLKQRMMKEMRV